MYDFKCIQSAPEVPPAAANETEEVPAEATPPAEDEEELPGNEEEDSTVKPPYSYAQLIVQALLASTDHRQTLSGIYSFISDKYPYYKIDEKGWKVCCVLRLSRVLRCIEVSYIFAIVGLNYCHAWVHY